MFLRPDVSWRKSSGICGALSFCSRKTALWNSCSRKIRLTGSVSQNYDAKAIEHKWQTRWAQSNTNLVTEILKDPAKKKYVLSMFPYPSGKLHMGHVRVYSITDSIARMLHMQGYKVLQPMGWDAFGLPAENAAIDRKISPAQWTRDNILEMKQQLKRLGMFFQWGHELATCDPSYYKWTQWIFLQLFNKGLAYRKEGLVNWDPIDQTVLANEQVDNEGRSWRSGAKVEQKLLKQWYLKITEFSEDLLSDLSSLKEWPEQVKIMQDNWIGKSEGAFFDFPKANSDGQNNPKIRVFTSRPDTIFGVTFVVLAPEHPLVDQFTSPKRKTLVDEFLAKCKNITLEQRLDQTKPKDGIYLGTDVLHPFTKKSIPVYVSPYVVVDYGYGAVMGVPAHDLRDFQFAKQHNLAVIPVVAPGPNDQSSPEGVYISSNGTLINSEEFSGLKTDDAIKEIVSRAENLSFGGKQANYRLKDWLVSRQRYWGAPIPIIHCPNCKEVPVPENQLPVELPVLNELSVRGNPLRSCLDWIHVSCPNCGADAQRETDTLDTFVDSSWYFLRYVDPNNPNSIADKKKLEQWLPVDIYVGGIEHAVLHLLYSRFIYKFLYDFRFISSSSSQREPFGNLITQEMVYGKTFRSSTGKYLSPSQVDFTHASPTERETGLQVTVTWEKMSKSKLNGIDPMDMIEEWGADVVRLFVLFKAPPDTVLQWDQTAIPGQARWVNRLHSLVKSYLELHQASKQSQSLPSQSEGVKKSESEELQLAIALNTTIRDVTISIEQKRTFNTAIASLMKFSNILGEASSTTKQKPIYFQSLRSLILMLGPLAPHLAAEFWEKLIQFGPSHTSIWAGDSFKENASDIFQQSWPQLNPTVKSSSGDVVVVIQVDGQMKHRVLISEDDNNEQTLRDIASSEDTVKRVLGAKQVLKVAYLPKLKRNTSIINFITKQ